jgi:ABC-2 type transport system permease protein
MNFPYYWHILRLFWTTSLVAELEYRLNFAIATLTSLGGFSGSLFSLFLFYREGSGFQGWTWQEAMLVLGFFTFLQGFAAAFLSPNLNRIVQQVEQGTLDFVLIKPISSQFWLSSRMVSPWGLPDMAFGLLIILVHGIALNLHFQNYLVGGIALTLGMVVLYSLWFMLGATSVWFVRIFNVTEVLRGLLEAGRFPIAAYPVVYRIFFTFVVPVAFLTTIPAQALLGREQGIWLLGAGGLAIALIVLSNQFWRFALRFYTSASS